jgi:6-pyruvoyltetrahydropterin/6-carboxytetrahydropterin synthase
MPDPIVSVRAQITISSYHMIPGHPKCGKLHGHNYKVEVWAKGPVDTWADGMVTDFYYIKQDLEAVVGYWDHNGIGLHEQYPPSTAETLCIEWLKELRQKSDKYFRIRVWETSNYYAEFDWADRATIGADNP